MFNRNPPGSPDLLELLRKLGDSPLLVALFLISPPDALRALGLDLLASLVAGLRPTTPEDARLVQPLLRSFEQGRTTLNEAQVIQTATASLAAAGQPAAEATAGGAGQPDVQLRVSKELLQHVLLLYAERTFKGQVFTLPAQRWGTLRVTGQTLALELVPGQVRLVALFQGALQLAIPLPLKRGLDLGTLATPVVLDIYTSCSIAPDGLLTLDIRHAEIRLPDVPLPAVVARELVRQLTAAMPTIPLVSVPSRFELPDAEGYAGEAIVLRPEGAHVDPDGVQLLFRLASRDVGA